MAALVCDICGGKLVMGAGGIAVCDSCGMEYSTERVKEKVHYISGTVHIDNSNMIENWIKMGDNAYEEENYEEAYNYYTKVIETDVNNWETIIKRGTTAIFVGKRGNSRIAELDKAVERAIGIIENATIEENSKGDALAKIITKAYEGYSENDRQVLFTILRLPNNVGYSIVTDQVFFAIQKSSEKQYEVLNYFIEMIEVYNTPSTKELERKLKVSRLLTMNNICKWREHDKVYYGTIYSAPIRKEVLEKFLPYLDDVLDIYPDFWKKYGNFELDIYPDPYDKLYYGQEKDRKVQIKKYWANKKNEFEAEKKRKAADKRRQEYWQSHQAEKHRLESRKGLIESNLYWLNKQLAEYKDEIKEIEAERYQKVQDAEKPILDYQDEIKALEREKGQIGFFAGKRKKELLAVIDSVKAKYPNIAESVEKEKNIINEEANQKTEALKKAMHPLDEERKKLEKEKKEIDDELNKDR